MNVSGKESIARKASVGVGVEGEVGAGGQRLIYIAGDSGFYNVSIVVALHLRVFIKCLS